MRRHPIIGWQILMPVPRLNGVAAMVRHHHERYDGRGYPDRLAGEAIPLGARILNVVDAYSAMTDKRIYKAARSREEAVAELKRCSGAQFDPGLVETFLGLPEELAGDFSGRQR
jgi:HD-GYP domain-containing protein (c-di-GMP phosphodiesterase class II)